MKVMLIIFLLLVSFRVFAPTYPCLYAPESEPINPYRGLIYGIGMVECKLDTLAVNPIEGAYGYFQIRAIRLEDYRKRTGINYSLSDMLDYRKAERVFMYYATRIGYRDPGKIARDWNGSGPKTWEYWKKVRKHLVI